MDVKYQLSIMNGGYLFFLIFSFFSPLLVASVAPGGSWWLLVASAASVASMASIGSWLLELLAPMAHLSSIDPSISEACSPGACCALDTP